MSLKNEISNTNQFSYTDLTYQDIVAKLTDKFLNDPRYSHFVESDIAPMVLELFAGMTDIINYNIERTAEESYFSTLKRYRSASKLAGDLGYDIQRPVPAKANIKFQIYAKQALKTDTTNSSEFARGKTIFIPKNTDFIYDGMRFVLAEDIVYPLSESTLNDIRFPKENSDPFTIEYIEHLNKTKTVPTMIQGSIRVMEFRGKDNMVNFQSNDLGKTFQTYYVDDATFSNYFGDKDVFEGTTTLVGVGQTYSEAMSYDKRYNIKRKSLVDAQDISSQNLTASIYKKADGKLDFYNEQQKLIKNVWVRTSAEAGDGKGIELRFGDGVVTDIGAKDRDDKVFVQYLSTGGKSSNRSGVNGQEVRILDSNGNLKSQLEFIDIKVILTSDINGGGDIESIPSLRNSVSGVFQTFDRLVTKKDYYSYLRSLTSPIDVKNAIAWGEQDELQNSMYLNEKTSDIENFKAIRKLFNVVLYTCVGSLYYSDESNNWNPKLNLYTALLDSYSGSYIYPSQNYITIMSQKEVVRQLKLNNMLVDGTIPIENYKFNMEFPSQQGYSYSNFSTFFNQIAYPRYWIPKTGVQDIRTDISNAYARFCGVPTTVDWTLSNKTSAAIVPLTPSKDSRYSIWYPGESLGLNIDLLSYKDDTNPTISLDLKRAPYLFNIYVEPNQGTSGDTESYPLRNIQSKYNNNTNETEESLYEPTTNISGEIRVGSDGFAIVNKSKGTDEYAFKMWENIMETTWDASFKPKGYVQYIENTSTKVEVPTYYGYTPWGYITNEIKNIWNYGIKESLTSIDFQSSLITDDSLSVYEKKIKDFQFISLDVNIEKNEQSVTDYWTESYIDATITIQSTNTLSDRLNNDVPAFEQGSIKIIKRGQTIPTSEFSLVQPGIINSNGYIDSYYPTNTNPTGSRKRGILLKSFKELTIKNNGKIRWFKSSGNDYELLPNDNLSFTINDFNLYSDFSNQNTLLTYFCKTNDSNETLFMTVDSIQYIISELYKLRVITDEYMINSVDYRSGEKFTSSNGRGDTIRMEGNYLNIIQNYVNGVNTGIETNYSMFEPKVIPNWGYFSDGKANFHKFISNSNKTLTEIPDWLRQQQLDQATTGQYVRANTDPAQITGTTVQEAETTSYYDWVSCRTFFTPFGVTWNAGGTIEGVAQDDIIVNNYKNKEKIIDNILGINGLSSSKEGKGGFYGYYPVNDVNIQDSMYSDKIQIVSDSLKEKNQLTVKSIYISPIIQQFQLWGTIYVKNLSQVNTLREKIYSDVYQWLDIENDFGKPLYKSNIIELIESHPEVTNVNLYLLPYNTVPKPLGQQYYFDITRFIDGSWSHPIYSVLPDTSYCEKFRMIVMNALNSYINKYQLNMLPTNTPVGPIPYDNAIQNKSELTLYNKQVVSFKPSANGVSEVKDIDSHFFEWARSALSANITERTFLNELCKPIIDGCQSLSIIDVNETDITTNKLFFMLLADIHNDFRPIIGYNMLNTHGDIAVEYAADVIWKDGSLVKPVYRGGYSLNNEIVQVIINTDFVYRRT